MTQPQLFPDPAPQQPPVRPPLPRSVGRAACPGHPYQYGLIGLVRSGRHLYWREHRVAQGKGFRLCRASDAPLCTMPARQVPGYTAPHCPCGGTP